MKNKLLAILTATLLVVTLIPMFAFPAFAEDSQVGQPLCFTAEVAGSTVKLIKVENPTAVELETSKNGIDWNNYAVGGEHATITLVNKGDKVYFRNKSKSNGFSIDDDNYYKFEMTGKIAASGDVTTLLNNNGTNTLSAWCFYELFKDCTVLTKAPALPATTLEECCYYGMFDGCTGLTSAPELPATTLAGACYGNMFKGCTALKIAPELPAKKMTPECYEYMFQNCTGLRSAPELPATTLAYGCYFAMFRGCTSLTVAPELPAKEMEPTCYEGMFYDCRSLTVAPELPAKEMEFGCYDSMFYGCTGLTSAPELPATTLAKECYNGMFNGCKELTSAPALPATTLAERCYCDMFNGCEALTKAPALPATNLEEYCYCQMFMGCSSLLTVVFSQAIPPSATAENSLTSFVEGETKIIVPVESEEAYKGATGWNAYTNNIVGAYVINIADTENGIVTANKQYVLQNAGEADKEVKLTVTPNEYYKLTSLKVTKINGEEVTVTGNKFSMPTSSVNITAKFETVKYKMTKGEKQVIDLANIKDAVFVSEADYSKFKGVMVDEKIIDSEYYIAESGSTMVTLKADYLKTLEVGKHEIKILSEDGMATAEFTIVKTTPKEEEPPKTDNLNNTILWELIALIGLAGIAGIVLKVKKSK